MALSKEYVVVTLVILVMTAFVAGFVSRDINRSVTVAESTGSKYTENKMFSFKMTYPYDNALFPYDGQLGSSILVPVRIVFENSVPDSIVVQVDSDNWGIKDILIKNDSTYVSVNPVLDNPSSVVINDNNITYSRSAEFSTKNITNGDNLEFYIQIVKVDEGYDKDIKVSVGYGNTVYTVYVRPFTNPALSQQSEGGTSSTSYTIPLAVSSGVLSFGDLPYETDDVVYGSMTMVGLDPFSEIVISKIDDSGNTVFSKIIIVGDPLSFTAPVRVEKTSDGGYLIATLTGEVQLTETESVYGNLTVIKLDSSGNIVWSKFVELSGAYYVPDSQFNRKYIVETPDGYIVASLCQGAEGAKLPVFVKFDKSGNVIWVKGLNNSYDNYVIDLKLLSNGDIRIAIVSHVLSSQTYVSFIETDSDLNIVDQRVLVLPYSTLSLVNYIELPNGMLLFYGDISPPDIESDNMDGVLLMTDSGLNMVWMKTYDTGHDDSIWYVSPVSDGNLAVVISQDSTSSVVAKFDISGNVIWAEFLSYTVQDTIFRIGENLNGNLLVFANSYYSDTDQCLTLFELTQDGLPVVPVTALYLYDVSVNIQTLNPTTTVISPEDAYVSTSLTATVLEHPVYENDISASFSPMTPPGEPGG